MTALQNLEICFFSMKCLINNLMFSEDSIQDNEVGNEKNSQNRRNPGGHGQSWPDFKSLNKN